MKNKKAYLIMFLVFSITASFKPKSNMSNFDKCDVAYFYEAIETESGVKIITSMGELEETDFILVPTELEEGIYEISITRKGSNIYKVEDTNYYIETRFCFEFAIIQDAILKVQSVSGFTIGTVYFE